MGFSIFEEEPRRKAEIRFPGVDYPFTFSSRFLYGVEREFNNILRKAFSLPYILFRHFLAFDSAILVPLRIIDSRRVYESVIMLALVSLAKVDICHVGGSLRLKEAGNIAAASLGGCVLQNVISEGES